MLKQPRFKKIREGEDDSLVVVDGVKLDAETAEVVFADSDKDFQVVVSNDPENETNVVVAVMTNSAEDVEEETILGSATIEGGEEKGDEKKCTSEARRAAFRAALKKRAEAKKDEDKKADEAKKQEAREAFRKRLEARRAARKEEKRSKDIAEARAKFRARLKKDAKKA